MRAAATVVLASPGRTTTNSPPGEPFPEWAQVTNPHAIAGGEAEADAGEDAPAVKRAPAKRPARATKPAPTE